MTRRFELPPSGARRDVVLLGSTGSIGTQALEVISRNPDRFRVVALAAGGAHPERLAQQAALFGVEQVAVADPGRAEEVQRALAAHISGRPRPEVLVGPSGAVQIAGRRCDVVLNGMTGAVGLGPTLAALAAGNLLALANKESLIIGGPLVRRAAAPGQIVPVDSEHAALAQALGAGKPAEVRRLVLTASGGPFRGRTRGELGSVTLEQALAHPTWAMGPVVTINSATLVNKGLEVIEAHLLFDVPMERIVVMVHPQSVIHSLVEFVDGSTLAHASPPDMRIPIAWGLGWPDRVPDAAPACDWTAAHRWTLDPLDDDAFPAVSLARAAGAAGGTAPAVFNAANEVAVAAFRAGTLSFLGIVDTVGVVLGEHLGPVQGGASGVENPGQDLTVDAVLAADAWAGIVRLRWLPPSRRERGMKRGARSDGNRAVRVGRRPGGDRDRRVHRAARDRAPSAREAIRSQSPAVHGRVWPDAVVAAPRRDRVRNQVDPARRLHSDDRHVSAAGRGAGGGRQRWNHGAILHVGRGGAQPGLGGDPPRRREPPVLPAACPAQGSDHARRPDHEPADLVRAVHAAPGRDRDPNPDHGAGSGGRLRPGGDGLGAGRHPGAEGAGLGQRGLRERRPAEPSCGCRAHGGRHGRRGRRAAGEHLGSVTTITRGAPGETIELTVAGPDGVHRDVSVAVATVYRPVYDQDGLTTGSVEKVGYLGIVPQSQYVPQPIAAVPAQMWDLSVRSAQALLALPVRVVELAQDLVTGQERDPNSPVSVVGVGRLSGEVAAANEPIKAKTAMLLSLMASLNLFLFLFNLVPLLPMDGGHVAGALWEGMRRWLARLRGLPDPGPVDVSRALPVAYAVGIALIALSSVVILADLIKPISLYG